MAKVSEEGINIQALVSGIRTKVNNSKPEERDKFIASLGSYLKVGGNNLDEIAPKLKPALQRANPRQLIDIATELGVHPSEFKSFKEPVGRINVSSPYNKNSIISGNRRALDESLSDTGKRRLAVTRAQKEVQKDVLSANAENIALKLLRGNKKAADQFIETGAVGHNFLSNIFGGKKEPQQQKASPVQNVQEQAEKAIQQGISPNFIKGFVDSSLKDRALQILIDNDETVSEANVQYVMEQLRQGNQ